MSVDAGHRYQFCKLLKTYFPDTGSLLSLRMTACGQSNMKSVVLSPGRLRSLSTAGRSNTGPPVQRNVEIWDEISCRHSEKARSRRPQQHFVTILNMRPGISPTNSVQLVRSELTATTNLVSSYLVVSNAYENLCMAKAADAAQSWGNRVRQGSCGGAEISRCPPRTLQSNVKQRAVKKAVHYNEWANFVCKDFEPVVAAFKEFLCRFRCESCESWLEMSLRSLLHKF